MKSLQKRLSKFTPIKFDEINLYAHKIAIYPCGLYYKHLMIVNADSSVVNKWSIKLIDNPSVVTYNRHRFIIQATGVFVPGKPFQSSLKIAVIL